MGYKIHFWEDVTVVADGRKRPGVVSLLEDGDSGKPQINISGRGTWLSAGDPEIEVEIFLSNIEKITSNSRSITISLRNKKIHTVDFTFKNNAIKEKCAELLRRKFEQVDPLLDEVGRQAIKLIKSDTVVQVAFPHNLWEINYRIDKSSLNFRVFVNYDSAIREFAPYLMDPTSWIGVVAFFAGASLKEYALKLPNDTSILFNVNQPSEPIKMLVLSSTVNELLQAAEEASGKPMQEAVITMLIAMGKE